MPLQNKRLARVNLTKITQLNDRLRKMVRSTGVCLLWKLSLDNLKWAYWIVRSRAVGAFDSAFFSDYVDSGETWLELETYFDNWALCPQFDMMNHSDENHNISYYFSVTKVM